MTYVDMLKAHPKYAKYKNDHGPLGRGMILAIKREVGAAFLKLNPPLPVLNFG